MNILLVEDNKSISLGLKYSFSQTEYHLFMAENLCDAKYIISNESINLVILDLMLPDGDGFSFYTNYLSKMNIKTIILTAVDDEDEVVSCLNSGVDDYMTKPFSTKELIARINRLTSTTNKNTLTINNITYNFDKMELQENGTTIPLTNIETRIINLLFLNVNRVVTRNELLENIWEWTGNDVDDHTVTVYLKRLRSKINTDIIKTIKGIGYRIDDHEK